MPILKLQIHPVVCENNRYKQTDTRLSVLYRMYIYAGFFLQKHKK